MPCLASQVIYHQNLTPDMCPTLPVAIHLTEKVLFLAAAISSYLELWLVQMYVVCSHSLYFASLNAMSASPPLLPYKGTSTLAPEGGSFNSFSRS